ncbi:MAG TPA: TonB-dependent receptor, partial [Bryobacteraceae bacterium]|nr:TonB-dependent receptor [Bryobacteraceae bacterium]
MHNARLAWLVSICVLLVLTLVSAVTLTAQIGGGGSIQGVISDQSGAIIPSAKVVATNTATGVTHTRETTESGVYSISPLPVGDYDVAVTAQGFQTTIRKAVHVDALSTVTVDVRLQIGETATQVTVSAEAPMLRTEDVRMGQTIQQELYTALPLAMGNAPRSPLGFVGLLPGITGGGGNNDAGRVFGGQANSQEVYVEGVALTNPVVQGEVRNIGLGVSVEAVDQFQLETAGAAVQFSGQGATNFVIKSGTNQFHGAVYEYFRNTVLDARGFFARRDTPEHQNQFGASVGGPIVRNRMFFFSNYDGFRYTTESAGAFASVPTLAMRRGDFSELTAPIFDPLTTSTNSAGVRTRSQFPGNIIPANRISKASEYFQSFLPAPVNGGLQSNFLTTLPFGYNNDNTTNKVDLTLNEKHSASFLFSKGHRGQATLYRSGGNNLPLPYADTRAVDEHTLTTQAKYNWVPTGNIVNQMSYGYARFNVPITNVTVEGQHMSKAGIQGLPPGEALDSFPEIAFGGPNSPTGWRGTNSRAFLDLTNTFTLQDNLQWTVGKHSVTFGGEVQWNQINGKERLLGSFATWNFSNLQTAGFNAAGTLQTSQGHSYASYLLGALNSANVTDDFVVGTGGRYRTYSSWVQDTYKATKKLTLILGLRYDIMTPYVEVADRVSFLDPDQPNPAIGGFPGALVFAGDGPNSCNCRTPVKT